MIILYSSPVSMPSETAKQYPDAPDLVEEGELTMEELKEAFRFFSHKNTHDITKRFVWRLFDDCGEGFISVARFREILREIDDEISEEELDGIISDVRSGDFLTN